MSSTQRSKCLACGGGVFQLVTDLGKQYVVDFTPAKGQATLAVPLRLVRCEGCSTIQLFDRVDPDRLYKKFWYRSHINEGMRASLRDVAVSAWNSLGVRGDDKVKVLDIGCNDGTLLDFYPEKFMKVGIDPASELVAEAVNESRLNVGIADYFNKKAVEQFGPFKVITAVAMFYDLENPVQFLVDCKEVLDPKGVLVIQQNYLGTMLQDTAWDNICHEHLAYYSVTTFTGLVQLVGLEIQGVELNPVNGGSFRAYITHPGRQLGGFDMAKQVAVYANHLRLIKDEAASGFDTSAPYEAFNKRIQNYSEALREYILEQSPETTMVYGASTRGSTLLQTLGIPEGNLKYAVERDPKKIGLWTAGTNLQIVDEEFGRDKASHFFVLPWHFMESIKRREDQWLARGGTFIVPLPHPRLETDNGEITYLARVAQ